MTEGTLGPVAVPTVAAVAAQTPSVGLNAAPETEVLPHDPVMDGFAKIAAERRSRFGEAPVAVPFGSMHLRIHRSMPASFALDLVESTTDPARAVSALRSVIIDEDRPEFERILTLPPDNPEGIDGTFLLSFISHLGQFYGGVPLAVS